MARYRSFNPHTRYGRRKWRQQAWEERQNETAEQKADRERMLLIFWLILGTILFITGIIILRISGPEALVRWLK